MRDRTVRSGLRFIAAGMLFVMAASFLHGHISRLLFLEMANEARLTFLGFFVGGVFGGCGVLVAAAGLLQSDSPKEPRVRLAPTFLLLLSLIVLFLVLAYKSVAVPQAPRMHPGESVNI